MCVETFAASHVVLLGFVVVQSASKAASGIPAMEDLDAGLDAGKSLTYTYSELERSARLHDAYECQFASCRVDYPHSHSQQPQEIKYISVITYFTANFSILS